MPHLDCGRSYSRRVIYINSLNVKNTEMPVESNKTGCQFLANGLPTQIKRARGVEEEAGWFLEDFPILGSFCPCFYTTLGCDPAPSHCIAPSWCCRPFLPQAAEVLAWTPAVPSAIAPRLVIGLKPQSPQAVYPAFCVRSVSGTDVSSLLERLEENDK